MADPYVAPPYVAPTYTPPGVTELVETYPSVHNPEDRPNRPPVDLPVGNKTVFDDPKSGWTCTEVESGRFIVSHDKSNEVFQAGSVEDAETTVKDVFTP